MIKIEITDGSVVDAFNRLIDLGERPDGPLRAIGEKLIEFTKTRFEKSEDPYGVPWAPNSDVTLRRLLHANARKNFTPKGQLSSKGAALLAGKKPLIGESKSLSTQFSYRLLDYAVTVSSPMIYAGVQQFGAKQGEFGRDRRNHPIPWGDIPARPFFPDAERGLPQPLKDDFTTILQDAILGAISGNGV